MHEDSVDEDRYKELSAGEFFRRGKLWFVSHTPLIISTWAQIRNMEVEVTCLVQNYD